MENKYYVYLHIRLDTGTVFYVGKGQGKRKDSKSNRNKWWKRVTYKTSWVSSVVQDNMSEDDAFLLEMWLIAKFRHEGVCLCNVTVGGEGVSGCSSTMCTVFSSDGTKYDSLAEAARAMQSIGYTNACSASIGMAVKRCRSLYGRKWSKLGIPEQPIHTDRVEACKAARNVGVFSSDGRYFNSLTEASNAISIEKGIKASPAHISQALSGKRHTAYGLYWSTSSIPDHLDESEYRKKLRDNGKTNERSILCSNGMRFESIRAASMWLNPEKPKASCAAIVNCCKGRIMSHKNLQWSYA